MVFIFFSSVVLPAEKQPVVIDFEGLAGLPLENAKRAVQVPPGLLVNGKLDEALAGSFVRDVPQKVREALEPFGYYQPEIKTLWEKIKDNRYHLKITVDTGSPIKVDSVQLNVVGQGETEKPILELIREFPLKNGDVLRQDTYEKAKDELIKRSVDLGYLQASFSTHKILITQKQLKADIELTLDTGPRFYFGDITFTGKGTASYPENFLRRYLEFKKGDIFSYEQMAQTQANYAQADRFREISVNAIKEKAANDQVPVEISLTPSPAKNFRIGAGYGTDTGPRGTLRYQDVNISGLGREFQSELQVSPVLQSITGKFILPGEINFRNYTSFTTGFQREDTTSYVTNSLKAEVERARGLGKNRTGSVFLQARQENSTAGDESTNTFLLMPGIRYADLHYDNIIRPRQGFNFQSELKTTHKLLASSTGFVQLTASGDLIIPLPADFALTTRLRLGATWQNDPPQDLPVSVRFFAGGDRSIRGYGYQSLGPKDDQGNVVGGRNLLVGSVEIERYIGRDWGAAVFYDAGNAFNNLGDFSVAQGAGFGIRYYSPIGPIRLDIARQTGIDNPDIRIHLIIGIGL